ncbi:UPF0755 protein [Alkalispirochaeta americana]|uniref:Endolytic murein transglycosylase n=1 Tax=Alkalispirochaeta americana TaxID=159291 RepID=A0A1N6R9Q7_9SPIO|nr:endolytic transglycosylase MltG [Alkalispirochaeta americana]SIQ25563.1 UPF0755 protein [Alkalispirochaeta americana]
MKKIIILGACVVGALVFLVAGGLFFVRQQLYSPLWTGDAQEAPEIIVEVLPGQGLRQVSRELAAAGLVPSARLLEWYGRHQGYQTRLQAGRYQVSPVFAPVEIMREIVAGNAVFEEITITIPEGWTLEHIAIHLEEIGLFEEDRFRQAAVMQERYRDLAFLEALEEGDLLEGYLFPATYRVFPESTPESVVRRMLGTFGNRVSPRLRQEIADQGRRLHDVITLASIVQKESAGVGEMPDVAGVFWHRLQIGMRLESDATVNYVLGTNRRQPTFADTAVQHPYNTYRNAGLPPGPIGNPGMDAILAAVHPADTAYLFFLHKTNNEIVLSRTFRDHLAAKARYLD